MIRSQLREWLPPGLIAFYDGLQTRKLHERNARQSTEQVFTDIYARNEWGGAPGDFSSGAGSTQEDIVAPYVEHMIAELRKIDAQRLTVVDLGCGDFRIGSQLAPECGRYVGVDIVKPLIEHHRATFASPRVSFEHCNIVEDALPPGDVCIVRQVFQHLSNAQILAVLPKLKQYRYCFTTEHHPSPARLRKVNVDKPHGADIRVAQGSGVFLDRPPFSVPVERYRQLFEIDGGRARGGRDPGIIRTYLLTG
ncbi:MAG TPA: class I SAM-dependent methyltransferase [Steroidobacteraceae bacterium]|jgi:hypothetical protein